MGTNPTSNLGRMPATPASGGAGRDVRGLIEKPARGRRCPGRLPPPAQERRLPRAAAAGTARYTRWAPSIAACGIWALGIKSGYGGGRFAGASPTRHQTRTRRCGRPGLARRGLPRAPAVPRAPHTAAPREVGAVPKRCAAKPARNENKLYNNAKRYFSVWPQI